MLAGEPGAVVEKAADSDGARVEGPLTGPSTLAQSLTGAKPSAGGVPSHARACIGMGVTFAGGGARGGGEEGRCIIVPPLEGGVGEGP